MKIEQEKKMAADWTKVYLAIHDNTDQSKYHCRNCGREISEDRSVLHMDCKDCERFRS